MVDLDNDGDQDQGVQVYAVAYWSNVWGGPFLEEREGKGWSTAYSSTLVDPANDDEISGGTLVVWAPNDEQGFPTGFGDDGLLFTEDDPTSSIPAGYSVVDINQEPFTFYKESRPSITLNEGVVEVNDYSDLSYSEAFENMLEKISLEYPFTEEKSINWDALAQKYQPLIETADNDDEFYAILRDFSYEIPDGHVNVSLNPDIFFEVAGGSFGMVLDELSDDRIIVSDVINNTPAQRAGIKKGAEIFSWNDEPVIDQIQEVEPYFGPYSTEHAKRVEQVNFLTRVPPESAITLSYQNPGESEIEEMSLQSDVEYESLFKTIPVFNRDELSLPVEGYVLDESGLGYVRITTFSDDYNMLARLWDHYIQGLIDQEVPGLIIDMRANGGGNTSLMLDFLGYFFDEEIELYESSYYSNITGEFEKSGRPSKIVPGPLLYDGEIAVLVSPNCVSACEGFSHALQSTGRANVIGSYPSAGAFGDVGRGQYSLPGEIKMQYPTGRPENKTGELVIEGNGVIPDLVVPVTEESVLGLSDSILDEAIEALLEQIR
jgi:C-terminal processing protease CtpA/Prc